MVTVKGMWWEGRICYPCETLASHSMEEGLIEGEQSSLANVSANNNSMLPRKIFFIFMGILWLGVYRNANEMGKNKLIASRVKRGTLAGIKHLIYIPY